MNGIPWFSTFTLFTELLVTLSVLYIFYYGYKFNRFFYKLTAITLAYEIFFNISYMASRAVGHKNPSVLIKGTPVILAAFHGIFSLLMFLALLVFMGLAWYNYKKGINYFLVHKYVTFIFIVLWLIAVFSGFAFYWVSYFK